MHPKAQIPTERWSIEGCLGQGASSLVYQGDFYPGRDRATGRLAALKVPRTEADRVSIHREAEVLGQLKECPCRN